MTNAWFGIGAVAGALAVMLGAFGAHGLKARVSADDLAVFETGVRYHMYHALALLAVGWLAGRSTGSLVQIAGWLFVAGIAVFSGSLYALVLSGQRWLGAITPLGGLALIGGWSALAVAAFRAR
jgi:uncharacterized membrane protein YgdD (TMEM256/DUF423 family)